MFSIWVRAWQYVNIDSSETRSTDLHLGSLCSSEHHSSACLWLPFLFRYEGDEAERIRICFILGDMTRQVVAHHYCSHINQDVRQCVIYDSDRPDARLIGVEYIISEDLFNALPAEEKKLWHSHVHEVKSGQLIAPGVPDIAEKEVMKELINTYGKTFHSKS